MSQASPNPYASPEFIGSAPTTPPHIAVRGPAIGLLITQSIWLLMLLGVSLAQIVAAIPNFRARINDDVPGGVGYVIGYCLVPGLILIYEGFTIWGAICMLQLRRIGVARMGAILSVIPVCSGCWILGIPFGIWALIVLNRPDVKAAFQ